MMKMMDEGSRFGNRVDKDEVIKKLAKFHPFVFDKICHKKTFRSNL